MKAFFAFALTLCLTCCCLAQEATDSKPPELSILKMYPGVWDAEFEVWPQGPDAESIKFKGVETIRAYGQHWLASDFDSEFMGQKMRVHSIVGYDLDKKQLVGTIIDDGPYSATMAGQYDEDSKTITWTTRAKAPDGTPMVQNTIVTHESDDKRSLELQIPGEKEGEFRTMMKINYVKRNE